MAAPNLKVALLLSAVNIEVVPEFLPILEVVKVGIFGNLTSSELVVSIAQTWHEFQKSANPYLRIF